MEQSDVAGGSNGGKGAADWEFCWLAGCGRATGCDK